MLLRFLHLDIEITDFEKFFKKILSLFVYILKYVDYSLSYGIKIE